MTQSSQSRISNRANLNITKTRVLLLSLVLGLLLVVGSLFWSTWQTLAIASSLKTFNLASASSQAQQVQPMSGVIAVAGGWLLPDLHAWHQAVSLVAELPASSEQIVSANATSLLGSSELNAESKETYAKSLNQVVTQLNQLNTLLADTVFIKPLFGSQIDSFSQFNTHLQTVYQSLLQGDHTYIVLFQNSEELRATGGFMGSYAIASVSDGLVTDLNIQDIYVPDGQFTGFVTPPAGVSEYLSSGNGLRLPDANWWPDFPSSAARILPFMAMGKNQSIDGVIAVNLDVAEKILQVTGPIYLPDYQTRVTAENFALVARSDRDTFFPGSTAKVHFLSHFMTQLKLQMSQLSSQQLQELSKVILASMTNKDIQIFSNQSPLQELFRQYHFSGELYSPPESFYLMNIESNVGINKANRETSRSVAVTLGEGATQILIKFENNNPVTIPSPNPTPGAADHLHYINYHRVLVLPDVSIDKIMFNDQEITRWDEEIITTNQGQQLKQIGFLIEIPERTQKTLEIHLDHPPLSTFSSVTLQKQSGIPPTPHQIVSPEGIHSILLEKDETFLFSDLN